MAPCMETDTEQCYFCAAATVLGVETTYFMPTSTNRVQLAYPINGVSASKSFQRFSF